MYPIGTKRYPRRLKSNFDLLSSTDNLFVAGSSTAELGTPLAAVAANPDVFLFDGLSTLDGADKSIGEPLDFGPPSDSEAGPSPDTSPGNSPPLTAMAEPETEPEARP